MSYRFIAQDEGELYSEACARVLRNYIESNGRREEILKKDDVKEAIEFFFSWHCPIQQRTLFGQEICEEMYNSENRNLINRVLYKDKC